MNDPIMFMVPKRMLSVCDKEKWWFLHKKNCYCPPSPPHPSLRFTLPTPSIPPTPPPPTYLSL